MPELATGFRDYLGDGVYADFDGYHIWLSTLEGNKVALEPPVLAALDSYRAALLGALVAEDLRRKADGKAGQQGDGE